MDGRVGEGGCDPERFVSGMIESDAKPQSLGRSCGDRRVHDNGNHGRLAQLVRAWC
jgi:hypothetical protein